MTAASLADTDTSNSRTQEPNDKDPTDKDTTCHDQPTNLPQPLPLFPPQPDDQVIPTMSPVPHHAPPEDTSELLSPWWSEEAEVTDQIAPAEFESPSSLTALDSQPADKTGHEKSTEDTPPPQMLEDESSLWIQRFKRQAFVNQTGQLAWEEHCLLMSNGVKDNNEASLFDRLLDQADHGSLPKEVSFPSSKRCHMVCLFRQHMRQYQHQEEQPQSPSSWNPFAGSWLVVTHSRQAFLDHIGHYELEKTERDDYYTIDLHDRFSHVGEDVTRLVQRTFTPLQDLTRRYIGSWKDGTQSYFFSRFFESARRGDAFFLLRDSARRAFDNITSDSKKKEDD
ncbi:hypothetical protein DM01DRAFT_1333117 [Hesseltinella vesiculosa]|uniref:Uncharacterized protein n=1 Tax=Hesseltinella vesiculosa TaxID=101127 RepID=A0A1X2GSR9_9FUNG|nr:hypothetical protein DM01DRAFT_1333117 [Hesseltinella vesiculosa]